MEEMNKKITQLEDKEITKLYNKAHGNPEETPKDRELAEEMLAASGVHEEVDKW
jgi:hypothetical protein